MIPFHFLAVQDWLHWGFLCTNISLFFVILQPSTTLSVTTGGKRFGVGGRHWPCSIIRGANTNGWQGLDCWLGVTITLALLKWIRCVPVKQSHDRIFCGFSIHHSLSYCLCNTLRPKQIPSWSDPGNATIRIHTCSVSGCLETLSLLTCHHYCWKYPRQ